MGASNASRLKNLEQLKEEVDNADPGDDSDLFAVRPWENGGPFPIINTTLNLVGGSSLSTEQRQAEVFMLTPQFCGSYRTGYRPTAHYVRGTLKLSAAVAVSGAAASPNMGPRTSVPLGMLMTFFNARLGYWIANPNGSQWESPWIWRWPWYLLREFIAKTTDVGSFCFLSDGGHLENLGLYSLIKRRCRYIIVSDAGCDPDLAMADLINALRMARIDFGCRLVSATDPSCGPPESAFDWNRLRKEDGFSRHHFAVGTLVYPDGFKSVLVYIKSTLTGDEPIDVLAYRNENPRFPHQTTADQFFDEAQFESYRALGYHIAQQVFADCSLPASREELFRTITDAQASSSGPQGARPS
jgi:hypothetical protein